MMTLSDILNAEPNTPITEDDYAAAREVGKRTLARERQLRSGAPYVKKGRKIYYRAGGIQEWFYADESVQVRAKAVR